MAKNPGISTQAQPFCSKSTTVRRFKDSSILAFCYAGMQKRRRNYSGKIRALSRILAAITGEELRYLDGQVGGISLLVMSRL